MKKVLLAFSVAAIAFTSCKKDDNSSGNGISKERLAGSYKTSAITMKMGAGAEQNVTNNYLDVCERDDITTLNLDYTYTYADAGVTCNPPGNSSGIWDLPGQNQFKIDNDVYQLDSFDGQMLQISQTQQQSGQDVKITVYMMKQ